MPKYNLSLDNIHPPSIPFLKFQSKYFMYEGQKYHLATCPTSIFKAACRQAHPEISESYGPLAAVFCKDIMDEMDRWYICIELAKRKKQIALI